MKPRSKNKKEKEYDNLQLEEAKNKLIKEAISFENMFSECEGDVYYSMYRDFSNSVMHYEREKEIADMPKVSENWDWSEGVVGEFRYRSI
tara:strand:- start:497 stop:766 length:270 start_codon:yes stop_codon:yes gene_type:complete